jgi:hypothetical protein
MWAVLLCLGASAASAATTTSSQPPVFRPNISESIPNMSALFDRGKATEQEEEGEETLSSSVNDDLVHLNESLLLALFNDMVEKEPVVSPEDLRQLLLLQDVEGESSDLFMQMSSETFHRNATPPGFSDQFGSFSDEASIFAGQSEGLFDDISELDSRSEGMFDNISELDSQSDRLFDSSALSGLSDNLSDNTNNFNYEPGNLLDHNIDFSDYSLSTINSTIQADGSLVAVRPGDRALADLIRQLFVEEKGINISEVFPSPNLEVQEAGDPLLKASPESSLVQVIQSLLEDENRARAVVETGRDQVNRTANDNGFEATVDRGEVGKPLEDGQTTLDDQRRGNGSSLTESVLETLQRLFRAGAGRAAPDTQQEQGRSNSTTTMEINSTANKSMLARILDRIMISPESRLLIELPEESVDSSAVNFGDEASEDVYLDGLDATRISFDSGEKESGTSVNSLVPLTSRQREKVGSEAFYVKAEIYFKKHKLNIILLLQS